MTTAADTKRIRHFNDYTFEELRDHAIAQRYEHCTCGICSALEYLIGAYYSDEASTKVGATYKQLAYIAHMAGMSKDERIRWYDIAQRLNLSQAHAAKIIVRLRERDTLFSDLDRLVGQTT